MYLFLADSSPTFKSEKSPDKSMPPSDLEYLVESLDARYGRDAPPFFSEAGHLSSIPHPKTVFGGK